MNSTVITNPVIWADVPDPDVVRVEEAFYMVSTSMHSMPGCPIMKSTDLIHWEIVRYVFDTLEGNDAHNLADGKGIYGNGSWAASLRHHNGIYTVCFSCNDMQQFYVYRTEDIEHGKWRRSVFDKLHHDPSLLFDEDGRVYVIYGNGEIYIKELTQDAAAVKPGGIDQLLLSTETEGLMLRCEGCHAYRLNGYYYLIFIEWPNIGNRRRRQVCYRSENLLGPYESKIIFDDDMRYHNNGIAQGAFFDDTDGNWYAMLFQDHDAVGRIPYVLPLIWQDGWPVIGIEGKAPQQFEVPMQPAPAKPLVISDEFNSCENKLALNWQWNHNPDNYLWSLMEKPGYLRLKTGTPADSVLLARNTLTQRTEGPACSGITKLDVSQMKPGDHAGLVALQSTFGTVGVRARDNGDKYVVMCVNDGSGGERETEGMKLDSNSVCLKIEFDFKDSIDIAVFYYSVEGDSWVRVGVPLQMKYTLDHFMGYRIGLFNYASKQAGGFVDFDYFHYARNL